MAQQIRYAATRVEGDVYRAFQEAWNYIYLWYDEGAFIQLASWSSRLPKDHPAQAFITAVDTWKDAIMFEYLMSKKQKIQNGLPFDYDYSFIGPAPVSFTDIFLTVKTEYQPPGWQMPDISQWAPGTR